MSSPQLTVTVKVQPSPEHSDAEQHQHGFSYTIIIENTGDVGAQVVGRHWEIADSHGRVDQVAGLAVVGHQPLLQPGERFQYNSWARINSPTGSMKGRLLCVTEACEVFYAEIPEFALHRAEHLH